VTHGEPGAGGGSPRSSRTGTGAVTVLVDLITGTVVAADGASAAAAGVALTAWALEEGLHDPAGRALDDPAGPLPRAARGEVVAAELLRRPAPPPAGAAVPPAQRVRVTGVPLGPLPLAVLGAGSGGTAAALALVSFIDVPGAGGDPGDDEDPDAAGDRAGAPAGTPAALPDTGAVQGLDLWTQDLPDALRSPGRGAWHDVVVLEGGSVGLAVGEVASGGPDPGRPADTDAVVADLRSVVRAYADERTEPGSVVMRVDQLVRGARIRRSATMVYGQLSPLDGGAWEWSWALAGHPPPVLVHAGRSGTGTGVEVLAGEDGDPVGTAGEPRATAATVLVPGDVLVLWTGGLVERRTRPLPEGRALLEGVCADLVPTDAAGVGEQLLARLGDPLEGAASLVVVRVPRAGEAVVLEPDGTPRRRRWQLPGEPSSIGRARWYVLTTSTAWGLPVAPEAELVVSELVANAVLHGWGPVGLRLRHTGRGLVVEVDDANPRAPQVGPAPTGAREGGYGLRVVGQLAEWGWRPSGVGKTVWALLPGTPGLQGAERPG
jgi:Stage II sporulation protein E (SpoIIE)